MAYFGVKKGSQNGVIFDPFFDPFSVQKGVKIGVPGPPATQIVNDLKGNPPIGGAEFIDSWPKMTPFLTPFLGHFGTPFLSPLGPSGRSR